MGQLCESENYPESKKILNSFKKILFENKFVFSINNYDNNCQQISSLSKNSFEKLGQMQQLRIDFIEQIRNELNIVIGNYYYNNINNNSENNNLYNNYNYMNHIGNMNNFEFYNINESEKILYYIIIMTLTLKSYLKRKYIFNELEKSLLELSIIILKKNYSKNDLKLVLYHLSRLFEILFTNFHNSQNYININDYLKKISYISDDCNILKGEEKYPFIFSHIISLGELFRNEYHNIIINSENQMLLMRCYVYIIIKNYDFIIQNLSTYKKILINKKNIYKDLTNLKYNKNDLIEIDQFSENIMKQSKEYDDLTKISQSNLYFFIICSQDTYTGKNIFFEFDKQIELGIKEKNLDNEINLIKLKEAYFIILFFVLKSTNYCSTMLLSFLEYFSYDNIQSIDIYDEMIISLYDNFNNNKIFIDKYSSLVSRRFIFELENYKVENCIIDKLFNYIYISYTNNYNINFEEKKENTINLENLYFFVNIIKYISFYYKQTKNIKIAYDILNYFSNFIDKIRLFLKKRVSFLKNNINELECQENFITTLNNFDYKKNDFYNNLNKSIPIPLSNFLSNYIIFINDFFNTKENKMANTINYPIITTITYLEISFIKNNIKKNIKIIIKLLKIYINILNIAEIIDYKEIKSYLNDSLKIIINETRASNIYLDNCNIKYNALHLRLIYCVLLVILIKIEEKKSNISNLVIRHNKIIHAMNQYNNALYSYCFSNFENIQSFTFKNIKSQLLKIEEFIIQKNIFHQIINFIKISLFNNDEDVDSENSFNIYRTRSIYQSDKNNIKININTNTNYELLNKLPVFLNDSLSYSNNSIGFNRSYLNMPKNKAFNNSYYSEGVNLPFNDTITANFSDRNKTLDIASCKDSSYFNLKI